MKGLFQFIFKCMTGFILVLCESPVDTKEQWMYVLFGTLGTAVFLLVFFVLVWLMDKYFFVRKNFFAEHQLSISFLSACIMTFIYFTVTYFFCQ